MCAARAREMYDRQAKERQKVRKGSQPGATPANLPELPKGDARDHVGKAFGVSGRSVDYATKVLKNAEPEVVKAVEEGRMGISTAAILSTEPPEVQRAEATRPKRNRTYKSVSNGPAADAEPEGEKARESFSANSDSMPQSA